MKCLSTDVARHNGTYLVVSRMYIQFVLQSKPQDGLNITEDRTKGRVVARIEIWAIYWPSYRISSTFGVGYSQRLGSGQVLRLASNVPGTFSPTMISSGQDSSIHSAWKGSLCSRIISGWKELLNVVAT